VIDEALHENIGSAGRLTGYRGWSLGRSRHEKNTFLDELLHNHPKHLSIRPFIVQFKPEQG
jgi:hypothetical protein